MDYWQIWTVAGIVLMIIEMLTPTMFFLNLALACFATAAAAVYFPDWNVLIPLWVCLSLLFLLVLRPLLVKRYDEKKTSTGMGQYVGKRAKVIEKSGKNTGVISIFDERWNAENVDGEMPKSGESVIIEKNEDLVMFVRKDK